MTIIKYDLSGFYNLRDGGGLAAADGRMRTLRLLRSDQPAALDRQDADFLRDLPLSSVIDLRTEVEVMMEPSLFKKGGFSVLFSTSNFVTTISTLPVASFGFSPPTRMRTVPSTAITSSLRSLSADSICPLIAVFSGSNTTCVSP